MNHLIMNNICVFALCDSSSVSHSSFPQLSALLRVEWEGACSVPACPHRVAHSSSEHAGVLKHAGAHPTQKGSACGGAARASGVCLGWAGGVGMPGMHHPALSPLPYKSTHVDDGRASVCLSGTLSLRLNTAHAGTSPSLRGVRAPWLPTPLPDYGTCHLPGVRTSCPPHYLGTAPATSPTEGARAHSRACVQ